MKKLLRLVSGSGLAVCMVMMSMGSASAAGNPFTCSSDFYQVISGQLTSLNPVTGTYSNIGTMQPDSYNAIGYNVQDNYIYGFKTVITDGVGSVGDLVRIASDGSLTDLGAVSGLPLAAYYNGSSDLSGNMYIRQDNTTIYKINISSMTATALTFTGDPITSANDNVFINNKLYFLAGNSLSIVDLATNVVSTVTVNGPSGWLTGGTLFGSGWSDSAGGLFFSNNASGSVYQITDLTSPTPTAIFKVAGSVTSNNDGANCALAAQNPFAAPVATNDSYTATLNTPLVETATPILKNDTGDVLSATLNTNPAHGSVLVNPDGTFTYTPANGFTGSDSFTYTATDSFGRTATATVTIAVAEAALLADTGTNTIYVTVLAASLLSAVLYVWLRRLKTYRLR